MKKNVVLAIAIIFVGVGAIVLFLQNNKNPLMEKAIVAERSGDLQAALSYYTEATAMLAPSLPMPDINRSKFLAPELLKKETMKYASWLRVSASPSKQRSARFAIEGIKRCLQHGRKDITSTEPKTSAFTQEKFTHAWNATFFAPEVKIDPSHAALSSGNFARNFSLIIVECGKNYSYELFLLNPANGKTTRYLLPSENNARLYAVPGEHLLLARSTVVFASGEIWRSHYTPLPITIPDKASLIRIELRTSVSRQK